MRECAASVSYKVAGISQGPALRRLWTFPIPLPNFASTLRPILARVFQGRNRRCVTIDLHNEEGRAVLRQLANKADVLVEVSRLDNLQNGALVCSSKSGAPSQHLGM